jgi:hypothetical protein
LPMPTLAEAARHAERGDAEHKMRDFIKRVPLSLDGCLITLRRNESVPPRNFLGLDERVALQGHPA